MERSHLHFTFTRSFLKLGKVTFDKDVKIFERYRKGDISYTWLSFQNLKVLEGLISHSVHVLS